MKHLLLVIALLFTFSANASVVTLLNLTAQTGANTSVGTSVGGVYSLQCDLTGTFSVSVQLQASLDGTVWTDVGSPVAIAAAGNLLIDINGVSHKQARVDVAFTSGTYAIVCKLKN